MSIWELIDGTSLLFLFIIFEYELSSIIFTYTVIHLYLFFFAYLWTMAFFHFHCSFLIDLLAFFLYPCNYSFTQSSHKYLLHTSYVPGPILSAGNTAVSWSCTDEVYILMSNEERKNWYNINTCDISCGDKYGEK